MTRQPVGVRIEIWFHLIGATMIAGAVCLALLLLERGRQNAICFIVGAPVLLFVAGASAVIAGNLVRVGDRTDAPGGNTASALIPPAPTTSVMPDNAAPCGTSVANTITITGTPQQAREQINHVPTVQPEERLRTFSKNSFAGPVPAPFWMDGNMRCYSLADAVAKITPGACTDYELRTMFNPYIARWGQQFLGHTSRAISHVTQTRSEAT